MTVGENAVDAQQVAAEARRVLTRNRQSGVSDWDGRRYSFVCPSTATYPFQWLWDSSFHAIALLHVDPELAKQELRCLLQGAQPDGFIPHMLLWEQGFHQAAQDEYSIVLAHPYYTATLQPPVLARAIWRVYQATGDTAFLAEVLPPTLRFFRWFKACQDLDDDGLIAIHPARQVGPRRITEYDVVMQLEGRPPEDVLPAPTSRHAALFGQRVRGKSDRPRSACRAWTFFNWEDVMVNTICADGLGLLGDLCRATSYAPTEASEFGGSARGGPPRPRGKVLGQPRPECSGICMGQTRSARAP